jgi:hypothetical protein
MASLASSALEQQIKTILGTHDTLDGRDFPVIDYINTLFPQGNVFDKLDSALI